MTSRQWFCVNDAWQPLGFKDAEALRRWIRFFQRSRVA